MINVNLVRKVIAYKTRESLRWIHVHKKWLWVEHDYWCYFGMHYSESEMLEMLGDTYFYKDGKVYSYPSIDFIFSSSHSETKTFSSDEEMFAFLEKFKEQFGKSFIVL